MPRFSIVATLSGDEASEELFAESLEAQTFDDYELVAVAEPEARGVGARLEALATQVVAAGGAAGARRMEGLNRCTGELVLFAGTDEKLSPAALQVLSALVEKGGDDLQMAVFHTQLYDRAEKRYLTKRASPRRAPSPAPFAPVFHAEKSFQKLGATPLNKLYRREFLLAGGEAFSAATEHGGDPAVFSQVAHATSVVSAPFPLAIARFDPAAEANALGSAGLREELRGLVAAVERFDVEGQSRAFLPSALEWLVGHCVGMLGRLDDEKALLFMDDMREIARPAVERLGNADMDMGAWQGYDDFKLACLDRLSLFREGAALAGGIRECRYEAARLELMTERLMKRQSPEAAAKPKRRGLFRR